jgi:hypothetical protein
VKSSIDDVAAVVGEEHMKEHLGVASEGIVAGGLDNTSGCSAVIGMLERHTFYAVRVRMEMQQMQESSIAEYDRSEDTVASSARQP